MSCRLAIQRASSYPTLSMAIGRMLLMTNRMAHGPLHASWRGTLAILAGLAVHATGSSTASADSPHDYQKPFTWTGVTFGVSGVYNSAESTWYQGLLNGSPAGKVSSTNVNIGGYMGANYQLPWNLVVGAELAFAKGTAAKSPCSVVAGANCQTDIDWTFATTGKLGYSWNRVLVYGKYGFGLIDMQHQLRDAPTVRFSNGRSQSFAPVIGFGLDYAVTDNVIAGVEYNKFACDVKMNQFSTPAGVGVTGADIDTCLWDVRAKLGVKF